MIMDHLVLQDALLVKETQWVFHVGAEPWNTQKPRPLIQADGCCLMNAGFQPKEANSLCSGMVRQMIKQ
jgi:hypothetical protein